MSKGEQTREVIVERAAQLFSRKGYFGASLSDLAQETGLGKSGFYNHFKSKDEIAAQAFEYSIKHISQQIADALLDKTNAIERLLALTRVYQNLIEEPFLEGGCPVLNTAVESDDALPQLRELTRKAMDDWQALVQRIVNKGIKNGEIQPEIDSADFATIFISTLEGSIMMSKLYGDPVHIRRAVAFLTNYISTNLKAKV